MQVLYWSSYLLLQGILARCMQRTSNVPLWKLYAKQECCQGPSSDLEYEREMLVRLMFLSLLVQAIACACSHSQSCEAVPQDRSCSDACTAAVPLKWWVSHAASLLDHTLSPHIAGRCWAGTPSGSAPKQQLSGRFEQDL